MPLAFGHLIGVWIPAKIVERVKKTEFSPLIWFALLFGALLPDADFFLEWLHIVDVAHRGWSHSMVFVALSFAIGYLVCLIWNKSSFLSRIISWKKDKPFYTGVALCLGVFSHLLYDSIFYPGINLLWPLAWWFSNGGFYFATEDIYTRIGGTLFTLNKTALFIIDSALGAAWIFYFLLRGKLKP